VKKNKNEQYTATPETEQSKTKSLLNKVMFSF